MLKERSIETEVGGFISTLLRKHFGKGPTSVYVTIKRPFIIMHFRGFTTTMEKILLKQNEWKRVLETRNLLVQELKPIIRQQLKEIAGWTIDEFYVDWNLDLETGTFLAVSSEKADPLNFEWPSEYDKVIFDMKLEQVCKTLQRNLHQTDTYWVNDRTLLICWSGVLTEIEKALIRNGHSEILKYTKRPLERSMLEAAGFESVFEKRIQEIFLDWDNESNIGYVIMVLDIKK
ncbi:Na-translocating system protein MpsC family protein [Planomicrobium okeanokoites]|uniref:Na-translocating system protein MpsC family protein n=1 Tax=Planomicrobium okeanokoites TaxID=244 RepID=UPI0009FBAF89|nr:Na-translocating system protein MpsC family protein [Planomicrobium okeanokoites]